MREYYGNERDRLLVRRWRTLWEQHRLACGASEQEALEVNVHHQCMRAPPHERQIVRPFVCAPHFYGCLQCGQEHLCYGEARRCLACVETRLGDGATLSCQYSGLVLDQLAPPSFAGTHSEQMLQDDNARPENALDRRMASDDHDERQQSRGLYKPRRLMLYSNSRHCRPSRRDHDQEDEVKEPHQRAARSTHREKLHPVLGDPDKLARQAVQRQKKRKATAADEGEADVEEAEATDTDDDEQEALDAEQQMLVEGARHLEDWTHGESDYDAHGHGRYGARDPPLGNEAYWDDYYGFLLETATTSPQPRPDLAEEETEEEGPIIIDDDGEVTRPLALQAAVLRGLALPAPVLQRIHQHCRCVLRHLGAGDHVDALHQRYFPPVTAVVALVLKATTAETPEALCEALLLQLFAAPYWTEDQLGHRLALWHACAWLQARDQSGAVAALFEPTRGQRVDAASDDEDSEEERRLRRQRKRRAARRGATGRTPVDSAAFCRRRVASAAAAVQACLAQHCRDGHALWLRHFILSQGDKLNGDAVSDEITS